MRIFSRSPEWGPLSLGSVVPASAGLILLDRWWSGGPNLVFVMSAAVVLVGVALVTWHALRGLETPALTAANWITVGRGGALALLIGFLATPPTGLALWIPPLLFGLAAGLDGVDGWVARTWGTVTQSGDRLDASMDGLTMLCGALFVVAAGRAHPVFLLAGLARYAYIGGIVVRRYRKRPIAPLDDRRLRKVIAVIVLLAIWVAMLPITDRVLAQWLTGIVLIPFLLHFYRDWLVVSCRR